MIAYWWEVPYLVLCAAGVAATAWVVHKRVLRPFFALTALALLEITSGIGLGIMLDDLFGLVRLLAWGLFVGAPVAFAAVALVTGRSGDRFGAAASALAGSALVGIGIDAFLIEPHALRLTEYTVVSAKVSRPYTFAVLSDVQTDHVGAYERRAFELARAQQPDAILLPGDYLQVETSVAYDQQSKRFRSLYSEVLADAALGGFAVQGNVEWAGNWTHLFDGLGVVTFPSVETVDVSDEIALTGLNLVESYDPEMRVTRGDERFHIALGHAPNFALGDVDADLLVAGHTHGGQVRLPFVGPLITFSVVPNAWAAGRTDLPGGRTLIVSQGVGMERQAAPRLRFLCPPEVVIIRVVPES